MHFLVKLALAAPASFLSTAAVSQALEASPSHFFKKLAAAAPASFFSVACALHVAVGAVVDVDWAYAVAAKMQATMDATASIDFGICRLLSV